MQQTNNRTHCLHRVGAALVMAILTTAALAAQSTSGTVLEVGMEPTAVIYADSLALSVAPTVTVGLPLAALQATGTTAFAGAQVGYQRGVADEHTQQDLFGAVLGGIELRPAASAGGGLAALSLRAGAALGAGYINDDNGTTTEGVVGLYLTPQVGAAYSIGPVSLTAGVGYQLVFSSPTTKRALTVGIGARYAIALGGN